MDIKIDNTLRKKGEKGEKIFQWVIVNIGSC